MIAYKETLHIINQALPRIQEAQTKIWIASNASACPDNQLRIQFTPRTALEAIQSIILLEMAVATKDGYTLMEYYERLGQMAYNYRYEGRWKIVQELISPYKNRSLHRVIIVLLGHFSENDIFGNLLKFHFAPRVKIGYRQVNYSRVKRPQRKRGYDDKGSMRPKHRWLPKEYPELERNEERLDLRDQIYTPRPGFWVCERRRAKHVQQPTKAKRRRRKKNKKTTGYPGVSGQVDQTRV